MIIRKLFGAGDSPAQRSQPNVPYQHYTSGNQQQVAEHFLHQQGPMMMPQPYYYSQPQHGMMMPYQQQPMIQMPPYPPPYVPMMP